ncbi:MAG: Biotin carboxyl carrier protein of acetyl-CoA carboxylase [Opitutia bacterium UBA7350]|nr:MAG: Biotin carboxyl carrier protein of acetyl-CoA carboxylase [Opitutae bacterium UBA7350]
MKRSELSEFEFEEEGFKLRLSRKNGEVTPQIVQAAPIAPAAPAAPAAEADTSAAPTAEEPGISIIKSPMVGTFYRSPSPDSDAFVDVHSKITEDSVVCIIEAMKVMNEIQAETKGIIKEILVKNGDSIEFGQPLFKVKSK